MPFHLSDFGTVLLNYVSHDLLPGVAAKSYVVAEIYKDTPRASRCHILRPTNQQMWVDTGVVKDGEEMLPRTWADKLKAAKTSPQLLLLRGTPDEAAVLVYCVRYMPELVVEQLQQNMLVAHARVYDPFEL